MSDLLLHLRRLAKQLNSSIINPNRGGCCVIAAEIADHLEKVAPTRIRVSDDHFDWEDDGTNLNAVADYLGHNADHERWNDAEVYFGHVIVEFDYQGRTYHMDTSGVKLAKPRDPTFGWLMYDGHIPLRAAKALAANAGNWNKKFDRGQIPFIRRAVANTFARLNLTQNPV